MTEPQLHYAEKLVAARLVVVIQTEPCEQLLWKRTFIIVVFHSEDSSPGGTCVVHDGLYVQWFDCEGVNDPDRDPLWKFN